MKKLLALLLALLIVASVAPLATAEETTVLTVGGWPAGDTAFKAIIPGFEAAHPGVKVELVFMSTADHHQQLATAIAAGSGASDVVMLEQAWVGRFKDGEGYKRGDRICCRINP